MEEVVYIKCRHDLLFFLYQLRLQRGLKDFFILFFNPMSFSESHKKSKFSNI